MRVATMAQQNVISAALSRSREQVANLNIQLETTKKVQDYASLGSNVGRVLSASSMLAQQQAQGVQPQRGVRPGRAPGVLPRLGRARWHGAWWRAAAAARRRARLHQG